MKYVLTIYLFLSPLMLLPYSIDTNNETNNYEAYRSRKEAEMIKKFESFSDKPYKDGKLTSIGYGFYQVYHLKELKQISRERADQYFDSIFKEISRKVESNYPQNHLPISHMVYWLGWAGAKKYVSASGNLDTTLFISNLGKYKERTQYIKSQFK